VTGHVVLHWIPLGAGGHSVRWNGRAYEAILAALQRRPRRDIYHSVLTIELPEGTYRVEMAPVPPSDGAYRGVVATGAVGLRVLGRLRVFRYEIRRWRDGIVPDIARATRVVDITDDEDVARRIFDAIASAPTPTWGRDELGRGEMWTCNSTIAWALSSAGVDIDDVPLPDGGRAPGWDAGRVGALSRRAAQR